MNAIRDRVPGGFFDREDDDEETEPVPKREDLLHQEESLFSKITPNSGMGYVALFGATVIAIGIFLWLQPLIPPWFTSLPSLLAMAIPVVGFLALAAGRQSGLKFWTQFDDIKLYTGSAVTEYVGKVDGSAGDDPLVKIVSNVSWGGLSVDYERVDDRFRSEGPLLAKINRKGRDGEWEHALGKLDHVYEADGESSVFDETVVVHCSSVEETPTAPGYEWKTTPPDVVDVDAARQLIKRDEILREQVIPHFEEKLETSEEQVNRFKQAAQDDEAMIKMSDLPELLMAFAAVGRPQRRSASTQEAIQQVDEDVEEAMEAKTGE